MCLNLTYAVSPQREPLGLSMRGSGRREPRNAQGEGGGITESVRWIESYELLSESGRWSCRSRDWRTKAIRCRRIKILPTLAQTQKSHLLRRTDSLSLGLGEFCKWLQLIQNTFRREASNPTEKHRTGCRFFLQLRRAADPSIRRFCANSLL